MILDLLRFNTFEPSRRTVRTIVKYILALSFGFSCLVVSAQSGGVKGIKIENLPQFDRRAFHFGFALGYNNADFFLDVKPGAIPQDSVKSIQTVRQPGFHLGIVSSLNITKNIRLRFLPSIVFQDRVIQYKFLEPDASISTYDKHVESTYLAFPLLFKFRTDRINNVAYYIVAGGKISIDMATQKDVDNSIDPDEIVIKLEKTDYAAEVGAGMDFFLPYFKFAIELKASFGIPNLLIDDGTRFSTPIESLRTKGFFISFLFEGGI